MKLTDSVIKATKPREKDFSIADGHGLVLLVKSSGAKWWRYRYRFNGTAKMLSLGVYPGVTLKQARNQQEQMRELLAKGIDPSDNRKEQKQQKVLASDNSFESIARLWWEHWKHDKTERHANYTIRRLKSDVFPCIGHKPINEITAAQLVMIVRKIESRGALELAKRNLTTCGQVLRYAVAHGLAERNPAGDIKASDVLKPTKQKNYARVSEQEFPELLRKIINYKGRPICRLAMQLMTLTFVRTNELINARWDEFDLIKKEWRKPAGKMKMRKMHIIPLSNQAIDIIMEIKNLRLDNVLLFPSELRNGKPMSNNTITRALERMGYKGKMTGHGFRGVASTILHEQGYNNEHIELQLAHTQRNAVSAAYNHALYLEPRTRMMQDWADYLDRIKTGATVLPFKTA